MWVKMKPFFAKGALNVVLASCFLNAGCWITRNWKDYMPIAEIGLDSNVRSYRGYFYPKFSGRHALSLRIKKSSGGDAFVGLRFKGEIRLFHDGQETIIPFDEKLESVTLPPTPFEIYLKTFDACSIKRSDNDYGRFDVVVEGDIGGLLEKEPKSCLSVSFCDAE